MRNEKDGDSGIEGVLSLEKGKPRVMDGREISSDNQICLKENKWPIQSLFFQNMQLTL